MKTRTSTVLGVLLFVAGLVLGAAWKRGSLHRPFNSPALEIRQDSTVTVTYSTLDEAIRRAPELVLEDLARDPYLTLTEAEMKLLAESIDLRKASHRQMLNQVLPLDFREELWIEVMRDNIGTMPLEELAELTKEGIARTNAFWRPIVDAIHTSPDRREILASDWGKNYLQVYLDTIPAKIPNLQEALALVPEGKAAAEMRERLLEGWLDARPTAANVGAIYQLPATNFRRESVFSGAANLVWNQAPAERNALLAEVDALPGQLRNSAIRTLAGNIDKDDPALMLEVISHFTSAEYQRQTVGMWLDDQSPEQRQRFTVLLEQRKNNPAFNKLRDYLKR